MDTFYSDHRRQISIIHWYLYFGLETEFTMFLYGKERIAGTWYFYIIKLFLFGVW